MWTPTKATHEKQHEAAKIYIDEMVERMGLDGFIDFIDVTYQLINRRKLKRDEIVNMIERAPKGIYYLITMAKKEIVEIKNE